MSKIFNYKPDEIDIKLFSIDGNDKEKFKPFPLNDRFLVSNMARCYDTKNKKFLKDYFNSSSDYGTWYIGDWTDNELERRSISLPIHKVVAETWCNKPPTDNRLVIDHIDGNKKNNLAENLRFVSYSENLTSQNVQEKKAETLRKNTEHRKEIMTLTKLLSKANNKIEELEKKIAELELGNKILISDNIKYIRMLDEIDEANMFSIKK